MSTPAPGDFPTVFYSWQSDLPKEACRNFIEGALKRALAQLFSEGLKSSGRVMTFAAFGISSLSPSGSVNDAKRDGHGRFGAACR